MFGKTEPRMVTIQANLQNNNYIEKQDVVGLIQDLGSLDPCLREREDIVKDVYSYTLVL